MSNHEDVRRAIELAASGQVDVEAIATHLLPIEQAQRGLELAHIKEDGAIKEVVARRASGASELFSEIYWLPVRTSAFRCSFKNCIQCTGLVSIVADYA